MRLRFRFAAPAVAWVGILSHAGICRAQTEPVTLDWQAPDNCPQQGEVQQQIRVLLGPLSQDKSINPLRVRGSIEPFGEHYRLTLRIERSVSHGVRAIESDDCKSLGKAAAVVLGLLVQKERSLGRELSSNELSGQPEGTTNPNETKAPPTEKPTLTQNPEVTTPPPPAEAPRRWHVLLRAPQASADFLTLPKVSLGVGLGLGFQIDSFRAMLTGTLYKNQDESTAGLQPFTTTYRRQSLEASSCFGLRSGSFEVSPCFLADVDRLQVRVKSDQLTDQNQVPILFSVGAGVTGHVHLHRSVALVAMAAARVITTRPEFQVNGFQGAGWSNTEQAHTVPAGTFGVSLGTEWIF